MVWRLYTQKYIFSEVFSDYEYLKDSTTFILKTPYQNALPQPDLSFSAMPQNSIRESSESMREIKHK